MERKKVLKEVLHIFNEHSIEYSILRNYEFLLGSSDSVESLDTEISSESFQKAKKILEHLGFIERKRQFSRKHRAFFKLVNGKKASFDIQVGGVYWNDMKYMDIENRVFNGEFYVPSEEDTFVMLLVHSILGKRYFKPKYQKILESLNIDKNKVILRLKKVFGNSGKKLINLNFKKINTKKLVINFILNKPTRIFILGTLTLRWLWQRKRPKLAPLISIIGPDGAGKSSTVKSLQSYLKENNRKTTLIYTGRGRNHILPITKIGRNYKKKEKNNDKPSSFKKSKKNNFKKKLIYTAVAPIFTLDLLLRYYFWILPERIKGKVVITDRYCSDIILMKNVPFIFKRFLLSLFPKPTITTYLYNDSKILHERRPEEPVPELERQMSIFRKFKYNLSIKTDDKYLDKKMVKDHVFSYLLRNWW